MSQIDEETPLLSGNYDEFQNDPHKQFCMLVGIPPSDLPKGSHLIKPSTTTLWDRVRKTRNLQGLNYAFTASLSNTLLLSQVILGAALTALGASSSSHILITCFGALNTVIAGLVAYLKSRGQPMRSRMFRDDLEQVVSEIENSEIMWMGIAAKVNGYNEIDEDAVSVRSEVARLTRLYNRAVRNNTHNNPDLYVATASGEPITGLRSRPAPSQAQTIVPDTAATDPGTDASKAQTAPLPPVPAAVDEDESPATAKKLTQVPLTPSLAPAAAIGATALGASEGPNMHKGKAEDVPVKTKS